MFLQAHSTTLRSETTGTVTLHLVIGWPRLPAYDPSSKHQVPLLAHRQPRLRQFYSLPIVRRGIFRLVKKILACATCQMCQLALPGLLQHPLGVAASPQCTATPKEDSFR